MTSMVAPVKEGGRTAGVAGIDMRLDDLAPVVDGIRPFGTGTTVLLSTSGNLVAGGDATKAGRPADAGLVALAGQAARTARPRSGSSPEAAANGCRSPCRCTSARPTPGRWS